MEAKPGHEEEGFDSSLEQGEVAETESLARNSVSQDSRDYGYRPSQAGARGRGFRGPNWESGGRNSASFESRGPPPYPGRGAYRGSRGGHYRNEPYPRKNDFYEDRNNYYPRRDFYQMDSQRTKYPPEDFDSRMAPANDRPLNIQRDVDPYPAGPLNIQRDVDPYPADRYASDQYDSNQPPFTGRERPYPKDDFNDPYSGDSFANSYPREGPPRDSYRREGPPRDSFAMPRDPYRREGPPRDPYRRENVLPRDPYRRDDVPPQREPYRRDDVSPQREPYRRDYVPPQREPYRRDDVPPQREPYRRDDVPPQREPYRRDYVSPQREPYRRDDVPPQREPYRREDGPPQRDSYYREGPSSTYPKHLPIPQNGENSGYSRIPPTLGSSNSSIDTSKRGEHFQSSDMNHQDARSFETRRQDSHSRDIDRQSERPLSSSKEREEPRSAKSSAPLAHTPSVPIRPSSPIDPLEVEHQRLLQEEFKQRVELKRIIFDEYRASRDVERFGRILQALESDLDALDQPLEA